jgi:hypothetical protein
MLQSILAGASAVLITAAAGVQCRLSRFPWEACGDRMLRLL